MNAQTFVILTAICALSVSVVERLTAQTQRAAYAVTILDQNGRVVPNGAPAAIKQIVDVTVGLNLQNQSATRSGRKSKTRRKSRGRSRKTNPVGDQNGDPELAAPGSLTRTKALLLAALRVWELKHRIGD